jgi:hypothetical protein
MKFIDFMGRPKQTATMNLGIGNLLSGADMQASKVPDNLPILKPIEPLLKRTNLSIPVYIWPNALILPELNAAQAGIWTGQESIDQGLAKMDDAFNKGYHP